MDKRLFEWINPGKNRRVGLAVGCSSMIDEVDVFGEGNVRPNFVGGVEMAKPYGFETVGEAVKSTSDGVDFMMSHGIIPRFQMAPRARLEPLVHSTQQPPIRGWQYAADPEQQKPDPDRAAKHPGKPSAPQQ